MDKEPRICPYDYKIAMRPGHRNVANFIHEQINEGWMLHSVVFCGIMGVETPQDIVTPGRSQGGVTPIPNFMVIMEREGQDVASA